MNIKLIDQKTLDATIQRARQSIRKRAHFNFHATYEDRINRFLNAMEPDTYVRPHKHETPDKREVFIILSGSVAVITFDNEGRVTGSIRLGGTTGNYGIEIPEKTWHTLVTLETGTVIYEIKDGPYVPLSDKNFAPWSPMEGDPASVVYLETLAHECQH